MHMTTNTISTTKRAKGASGRSERQRRDDIAAYFFLLPFLLVYIVLVIYPVVQALYMSFFDWDLLAQDTRSFIGIENYVDMLSGRDLIWSATSLWVTRLLGLALAIGFVVNGVRRETLKRSNAIIILLVAGVFFGGALGIRPNPEGGRWYDAQFWNSLGNTLQFVLLSTPLIVFIGLLMAVALNNSRRLTVVFRTIFFAPYVFSVAGLTLIWGFLLNPQSGILAATLEFLSIEPIPWLTDPDLALPAIVVTTLWWTVGFNMVLFLAGLQDIDPTLYEAASIDGANEFEQFWNITVPGLRRTLLLVVVLQIIASFQIFGQVFIMTRGGPGGATRVLIQHIYESGFRDFDLGYASAMSIFLFVVMFIVSYFQFQIGDEDE
jgi:multiple sugar transport system permease protein